jgi:hypothetical protein
VHAGLADDFEGIGVGCGCLRPNDDEKQGDQQGSSKHAPKPFRPLYATRQ